MSVSLSVLCISPDQTIRDAITAINRIALGIVLVTDTDSRLLGTITDGDIRRTVLDGVDLDMQIRDLLARKPGSLYPEPITALQSTEEDELLRLMKKYVIQHIPLLDEGGRVVDLVTMMDLLPEAELPVQTVIMAGGIGRRLSPLTTDVPKPMLPVGNQPLLELTINQLRRAGIRQVNLTTHYKPEVIVSHFGDGQDFGVQIRYLEEDQPLGTAGSLNMLSLTEEPILVVNGDVLTQIDYRSMLDFHKQQNAEMTVAVRLHEFQIPYGVMEVRQGEIKAMTEKPTLNYEINAGVYLLNPGVLDYLPKNQPYDMPDLINRLIANGRRVVSFPIHEYWLDINEYEDYQQALQDAEKGLFANLEAAMLQFEPGTPAPPGFIPLSVPEIRGNEWAYIKECLDTNWVSSVGPFVSRFEEMLAVYVGVKFGVATVSGTAALHIALLVSGVQPDDEVLVSALTFIAPANAVRYVGAFPVFVDAEPRHWQMDPNWVADFLEKECHWRNGSLYNKKSRRRVKAIIPVHILGHPCDMDPILELAKKYNLIVIEDASESLGATYKGRMTGNLGDIACFSFNGNKIITTGGGGMLVTDNEKWSQKAKYLTTQAKDDPIEYIHNEIGYNYRLTNIQAAMGCAQMEKLGEYIQTKREIAEYYENKVEGILGIDFYRAAEWANCTFWLSNILVDGLQYGMGSRELMAALADLGIQSRPLWHPPHGLKLNQDCQALGGDVARSLYTQALSLPCSIGISKSELERVIQGIKNNQY